MRTPGPWERDRYLIKAGDQVIAIAENLDNEEANATYIVRAVNAHDELVAALEATRGQWIHSVHAEQCLSALAKAEA